MAISPGFRQFVLEQLSRVTAVVDRRMFGGLGLYARGVFFALAADEVLYFKVDAQTRPDFEREHMGPFRPFGEQKPAMSYYAVPLRLYDDADELAIWVAKAIAVAERASNGGKAPPTGGRSRRSGKTRRG